MIKVIIFLLLCKTIGAVFAPADRTDLKAAVISCITETPDGSCPVFASSIYNAFGAQNDVIGNWDVSKVTNMDSLFRCPWDEPQCTVEHFNADISKWDVSIVTTLEQMFYGFTVFNSNLTKWDTSRVTSLYKTFNGATAFNSDLSEWDVSRVNNMGMTFSGARAFNADISKWNCQRVSFL